MSAYYAKGKIMTQIEIYNTKERNFSAHIFFFFLMKNKEQQRTTNKSAMLLENTIWCECKIVNGIDTVTLDS